MDFNQIAEFFQQYFVAQWPFFLVAWLLGIAGQIAKTNIWSKQPRYVRAWPHWSFRLWWFGRATLPLHAAALGALGAVICLKTIGLEAVPVGPGITTKAQVVLYFAGSGGLSSMVYNTVRHWLKQKGIDLAAQSGPDSERVTVADF